MNQVIQTVLAAFSNQNIEINTARKLANLKIRSASSLGGERRYCDKTECGKIPLRLYFPSEETKGRKKRFPPRFFYPWRRMVYRECRNI